MKVYCMCVEAARQESDKANHFLRTRDYGPVILGTPMLMVRMGVVRMIRRSDSSIILTPPNADVLTCPLCGRNVVIE